MASYYCDQVRLAESDLLASITPPQKQFPVALQVDCVSLALIGTNKSILNMITVHKWKPLSWVLYNGALLVALFKVFCADENAFLIWLE